MQVVRTIAELRALIASARQRPDRIGFVPTMGALHEGHLALVDAARAVSELVVMSIFVNPLQFGPTEDLARYPRDERGDTRLADGRGVDVLFLPDAGEVYGKRRDVTVTPGPMAALWEGALRPGHFAGVLTIVAKLFNLVQPTVAVFGQKDFQQAALIRAMVRELNFPTEILTHPIVRDSDGLALSSRNRFLDVESRSRALAIPRSLAVATATFGSGERRADAIESAATAVLSGAGITPDYVAVVDADTLERVTTATAGNAVIIAAKVGGVRLLDNVILS